jgi:serine/threonine protein kinase
MGRGSDIPMGRNFLKMTMLSEVATLFYRAPDGILNIRTMRSNNPVLAGYPDSPRKKVDTPIPSSSVSTHEPAIPRRDSHGKSGPALRISGGSPQSLGDPTKSSYTAAVDLWACGCIMAELLLRKPIFPGKTNKDLLELIVQTVGSPSVSLLNKIPEGMYKTCVTELGETQARIKRDTFAEGTDPQALDLLSRLLALDPEDRITVDQALLHPYLSDLYDPDDDDAMPIDTFTYPEDETDTKSVDDYRELIWSEITTTWPF